MTSTLPGPISAIASAQTPPDRRANPRDDFLTRLDDVIGFSNSMSCENWLAIPTSVTTDITHLRNVTCNDHRHPLVKIRLKQPGAARTELAFLFGLVSELQRAVARLTRSKTSGGRVIPLDFDDCYTFIDDGKVKVCCPNPPECTGVADVAQ